MPLSGEQVWRRRAHEVLERGGTSLEEATSPRAGRNPTRGGDRPSSKVEPRSRRRPALERGGTLPEGATVPRARRRFANVVPRPSSEVEFCPRVAGPTVWWAIGTTWVVGPWVYLTHVLGSFAFCFLAKVSGFPWLFRGPLWLSPTVAPEHLWVYPL
jgi:hypothetical protein